MGSKYSPILADRIFVLEYESSDSGDQKKQTYTGKYDALCASIFSRYEGEIRKDRHRYDWL